ncbi:MAG: hypothetical protein IJ814_06375 [Paludibacteraceae bacterium]|nr:hypothetical protein [Paludibacteraceae bacterium]
MKKQSLILFLSVWALCACTHESGVTLPTFSDIRISPAQEVYHKGDSVVCTIDMLTPGDASLKQATYWFYTSWWGSDANLTADFQTPDTIEGVVRFTSSKIELAKEGDVRIYFWGRLEYPNWNFQPVQIPVSLKVEP